MPQQKTGSEYFAALYFHNRIKKEVAQVEKKRPGIKCRGVLEFGRTLVFQ
jgi:hypothetical protein